MDADFPDASGENDHEDVEAGAASGVDEERGVQAQSFVSLPVGRSGVCDVTPRSSISDACKMVAERSRASPETLRSDRVLRDRTVLGTSEIASNLKPDTIKIHTKSLQIQGGEISKVR